MPQPMRLAALVCFACCVVMLMASPPAGAANEEATRIGGIDVVVWTPSDGRHEHLAVVVFSHALYLCPTQSRYLTEVLADAGYLVIAPRHGDSGCSPSIRPSFWRMSGKPSPMWSDDDYRDRGEDIRTVVAALPDDPRYSTMANLEQLALVGHSLGGYTVLGLGGAWPSWRLPGVRAIVAMTPYSLPFESSEGLRHISVPVMYQAGSLDPIFTMPLEQFGYEETPAPKYLVKFPWANHMAWTDFGISSRDAIVAYMIAFLDHYVRDAPEAELLHTALPGVANLLHDSNAPLTMQQPRRTANVRAVSELH